MKYCLKEHGVTLMELVVTLALLGILAAIGTPVILDNINTAKNVDAKNTLNSIYLMQKNYFEKNNCYYSSSSGLKNDRLKINELLFESSSPADGPIVLNNFDFLIVSSNCNEYEASATRPSVIYYKITQQNIITSGVPTGP